MPRHASTTGPWGDFSCAGNKIVGAALVPALTLGAAGAGVSAVLASATPAASAARDWSMPTPLTEAGGHNSVQDVRITSDGTAVAVWVRDTGEDSQAVWAATRPAKATAWRAPVRVAATEGAPEPGPAAAGSPSP
ncbi:hypothetical protein ACIRD2_30240 [Streptomyces sp. NPDC093595]|uniref:hypothetical protein n=1 Tax=Streptomyces sp. NPDC093595 TaxID=3366045 RepID=UPI0037F7F015